MGVANVNHVTYLEDVLNFKGSSNPGEFQRCLDVMTSYEKRNDSWWTKYYGDDVQLAYHQLKEPVLLIPKEVFKSGIRKVVKHEIKDSELSINNKRLINEFYAKFPSYIVAKNNK